MTNRSNRAVAIVPVRLTSSRLPRKQLLSIGDRSILDWVVYRLQESGVIDEIVISSPDEPETEELAVHSERLRVSIFRYEGDSNDIVGRLTTTAQAYDADICVMASGDCPLIDSLLVRRCVDSLRIDPDGAMVGFNRSFGKPPIHEGVIVHRREVWERADRLSDTQVLRKHQFPVIGRKREQFADLKVVGITEDPIYYSLDHRLSVDTPDDLTFMRAVYAELLRREQPFDLYHALQLFQKVPSLLDLNGQVRQKTISQVGYRASIELRRAKSLSAQTQSRVFELANFLINHHGMGVTFQTNDKAIADSLARHHFSVNNDPAHCDLLFIIEGDLEASDHGSVKVVLHPSDECLAHDDSVDLFGDLEENLSAIKGRFDAIRSDASPRC